MVSGYIGVHMEKKMKISIEIREPDSDGKRAIRLVYYGGSYTDPETALCRTRHRAVSMRE